MKEEYVLKLTELFSKSKPFKYTKGELIYREGDVIHELAFLKSGYVRLYMVLPSGKEVTINLFKPVFIITLMCALKDIPCNYYMEAATDVEMWKAPKGQILEQITNDKTMLLDSLMYSLNTFDKALENIEDTSSRSAGQKVASLLYSLAKSCVSNRGISEIEFGMTKSVIGSLAGITRETATNEITSLEKKGLLRIDRDKIQIFDLAGLKEYADL